MSMYYESLASQHKHQQLAKRDQQEREKRENLEAEVGSKIGLIVSVHRAHNAKLNLQSKDHSRTFLPYHPLDIAGQHARLVEKAIQAQG